MKGKNENVHFIEMGKGERKDLQSQNVGQLRRQYEFKVIKGKYF